MKSSSELSCKAPFPPVRRVDPGYTFGADSLPTLAGKVSWIIRHHRERRKVARKSQAFVQNQTNTRLSSLAELAWSG